MGFVGVLLRASCFILRGTASDQRLVLVPQDNRRTAAQMISADSCTGTDSAAISCVYVAELDGVLLVAFVALLVALVWWSLY